MAKIIYANGQELTCHPKDKEAGFSCEELYFLLSCLFCTKYTTTPDDHKSYNPRDYKKSMHATHVKYGYTLKEVADHCEIHYTAVSKAIKGLKEK